jgi:Caspase domain
VRAALAAAHPGLGLIVLDACRNNPLSESGLAARGLARAQGGSGLLIAYATDPGNVAYDGSGENSVFTSALVESVGTPGLEVRLMFGRVRQEVVLASGGRQVPWVEEAVLGEHYLSPGPPPRRPDVGIAGDVTAWRAATAAGAPEAYRAYLERAPDGLFAPFARERIAALAAAPAETVEAGVPAGADRETMQVALATLGFLAAPRGVEADDAALSAAFEAYARQVGGGEADLDGLYLDAAQVTVMLGAATAQRIRTDMAALESIETTLGMASRARGELAALAETEPDAQVALGPADADIAAIEAARETVLERLDQSRSYYGELVERGSTRFRPYLTRSLAGLLDRSRSLPGFEGRVAEDAGRFVRHADADGVERTRGSIGWLADFLPGS